MLYNSVCRHTGLLKSEPNRVYGGGLRMLRCSLCAMDHSYICMYYDGYSPNEVLTREYRAAKALTTHSHRTAVFNSSTRMISTRPFFGPDIVVFSFLQSAPTSQPAGRTAC